MNCIKVLLKSLHSSATPLIITTLKLLGYIIFYYTFSISLTFYNKWMLRDFPFPLFATMFQALLTFIFTALIREIISFTRKAPLIHLSGPVYVKNVLPTSISAAYEIGLSNWSFQFITVSLYTMCKTTSVIFILVFAVILKLEKFSLSLIGIVLFISTGLFMFTYHSTAFSIYGFILVMVAAVLSSFRWTTAQFLVQKADIGLDNPIDVLYHVTPVISLCLFPLAFMFEGTGLATSLAAFRAKTFPDALLSVTLVFVSSLFALALGIAEYLMVQRTSSLTLSISSVFKEVITLYIAINWFNPSSDLAPLNIIGMVICLSGICLHIWNKAIVFRNAAKLKNDFILGKACGNSPETHQMVAYEKAIEADEDTLPFIESSDCD